MHLSMFAAWLPYGMGAEPLLDAVNEIVEQGDAVGLGPNTDLAGVLESVVLPLQGFLAVKDDGKIVAVKIHAECVPLIGGDFYVGAFLLGALALDGVIDGNVVFE